ncbi:hypothetical protein [Mycolicibacterium holsaticum]|uniref:hypothetical protein n=1 Tax=Mycolicibacterium holsaticum TaxID=152142 RepID=UPI001E2E23AE|nr:hypothetical protein [Mycolicibacterium holsaticum]
MRNRAQRSLAMTAAVSAVCGMVLLGGPAAAEPFFPDPVPPDPVEPYDPVAHFDQPQRLPAVTPAPSDWQPKFLFPFDETRQFVTDADINAQREMCQWYSIQYKDLKRQIAGLNNHIVRNNGDWNIDGVGEQADIVTANLDQAVEFLTPRVGALTRSYDRAGDMYFPLYQADSFHGLWQQMSNVSNGIRARQPTWFSGPSYHLMQFWGSKIQRSHVCR